MLNDPSYTEEQRGEEVRDRLSDLKEERKGTLRVDYSES